MTTRPAITTWKTKRFTSSGGALRWLGLVVLLSAAVLARAAEPFFFIQLSDPQLGMFANNTNCLQETANFEFAVATVNRLRPAFVVITGDLVNRTGDAAQIAEYQRIVRKIDPAIPVYNVPGNHDVGNVPTRKTIAAYTNVFGPDYYSFRHGDFVGIVLDSNLIQAPQPAAELATEQERWLKAELKQARDDKAREIVVFQHHPWFLKEAGEANQYYNLPRAEREKYLPLLHEFGVQQVFCGHCHHNALAHEGDLEIVTTGPVGKPIGQDPSGLRIVTVAESGITHHYYGLGEIPTGVKLSPLTARVPKQRIKTKTTDK